MVKLNWLIIGYKTSVALSEHWDFTDEKITLKTSH